MGCCSDPGTRADVFPSRPAPASSKHSRAVVVLAVHLPAIDALAQQVASIVAQRGVAVEGIAVLDGLETAESPCIRRILGAAGFSLVTNTEPLGVRGAFTRGLETALARETAADTVFCFSDQDDIWHPDKLALSIAAMKSNNAALVHCDARLIGPGGEEIARSLHRFERRTEAPTLFGAMLLNAVTGMSAVFPRDTAILAQRLLAAYDGPILHDHVTALAAAALGRTVYLERALVDYRQHGGNHLGAKPSRAVFRKREIGVEPLGNYRATSVAIFRIRRVLAQLLDREGVLPDRLRTMFLLDPSATRSDVAGAYTLECGKLFFKGQMRRWELGIRLMDSALFLKDRAAAQG
jgi:hypothetical protein